MYMYYSMFGFQRIGDIAWAAGDAQAQGFLLGATAGRTTLNGEGLQHQDGHSHILANTIPNCVSYDPCFGYELAVIVHDGLTTYVCEPRACVLLPHCYERKLRTSCDCLKVLKKASNVVCTYLKKMTKRQFSCWVQV